MIWLLDLFPTFVLAALVWSQVIYASDDINNAPVLTVFPEVCEKQSALWGRKDAGGWYVCNDVLSRKYCVVYSYGLGADWSFDKDAEVNGCEVHGFDPTNLLWQNGMHGPDYSHFDYAKEYPSAKKFFHNWGLGALDKALYPAGTMPQEWPGLGDPAFSQTNSAPWDIRSIERTMSDLGHSRLTILKIDVEGAEWAALAAFLESRKMRQLLSRGGIEQLLIEWHWDPNTRAFNERHKLLMQRLERLGMTPWRVERHVGSDCCLDVRYDSRLRCSQRTVWLRDGSAKIYSSICLNHRGVV